MASTYNLGRITLTDMVHASANLRRLGENARSMEAAAGKVVRFVFDSFIDGGERSCVLVRLYKTHLFGALPAPLRDFAAGAAGGTLLMPETRCLALLSTSGVEPAWNSRQQSSGHRAIPLPSVEAVARLPMVTQLLVQLGYDVADVVAPSKDLIVDTGERAFNVFHVPDARGSPYIPAQGFVERYGVRSVLGFGGALPGGELFALILFARTPIDRNTAEIFKPLSLAMKLALVPFASGPVFDA